MSFAAGVAVEGAVDGETELGSVGVFVGVDHWFFVLEFGREVGAARMRLTKTESVRTAAPVISGEIFNSGDGRVEADFLESDGNDAGDFLAGNRAVDFDADALHGGGGEWGRWVDLATQPPLGDGEHEEVKFVAVGGGHGHGSAVLQSGKLGVGGEPCFPAGLQGFAFPFSGENLP